MRAVLVIAFMGEVSGVLGDGAFVFAQVPDLSNASLAVRGFADTQIKMRKICARHTLMTDDSSPRWRLRFSQTPRRS